MSQARAPRRESVPALQQWLTFFLGEAAAAKGKGKQNGEDAAAAAGKLLIS